LPYIDGLGLGEDVCRHLKDGRCNIYNSRPEECKIFPFYAGWKDDTFIVYVDFKACPGNPTFLKLEQASKEEINNFKNQLNTILEDFKMKLA